MSDLLQLVWDLGKVAEDAALRGDDRAADVVRAAAKRLMADQAELGAVDRRREKDRTRKRTKSTESAESTDSKRARGFSPTPPFPNPEEEARDNAREAAARLYASSVENLQNLLSSRVGEEFWPDVDGFVKRREYDKWGAWMKEMLSCITGGQAVASDLAQVCRDDAALAREIGSPKGLRTFVASAARERINPPAGVRHIANRGGTAQRTFDNGKRALEGM